MSFPNILSQQVEGQDKDELTSQNFILGEKKKTIKGISEKVMFKKWQQIQYS